jgi:hypothetical protein
VWDILELAIEKKDMIISAITSYANVTDKNQNARKFVSAAQNFPALIEQTGFISDFETRVLMFARLFAHAHSQFMHNDMHSANLT